MSYLVAKLESKCLSCFYISLLNKSKPLVLLSMKLEECCRMLREVFEVGELITAHPFSAE